MAKQSTKTEAQKSAKFREIAEKRMSRILNGIKNLSKLSAKSRYAYSPAEVDAMETAFKNALGHCFGGFRSGGTGGEGGFRFK